MPPTRTTSLEPFTPAHGAPPPAEWHAAAAPYPRDLCLPQLVEAQVARTPQAIAAVFGEHQVTYHELNQRANRLAHHLRALGVVPDQRVAVCLTRGIDMLVAMLAVMKAGGAYLPLDPEYPAQRLAFMLGDAGVRIVLTADTAYPALAAAIASADTDGNGKRDVDGASPAAAALQLICLDRDANAFAAHPATDPVPVAGPEHLAYVIYTSGSTGRPKG